MNFKHILQASVAVATIFIGVKLGQELYSKMTRPRTAA